MNIIMFTATVLLLMLAGYSCEALLDTYSAVGNTGISITVNVYAVDKDGNRKMSTEDGAEQELDIKCSVSDFNNHQCAHDLTWRNQDFVQYNFNVPDDFTFSGQAEGLVPKEWIVRFCFAEVSQTDRSWRVSEPDFKRDKRCKYSTTIPYVAGQREYTALEEIRPDTPRGLFTADLFHRCQGQGTYEYCYISRGIDTYATVAIDSRPTILWVLTLISAIFGPLLYTGSIVYEREIKKKS